MNAVKEQTETAAQMEQAVKQFNEAMEELRPALEAMMEAIREWVRIFIEYIERICELVQRWLLYVKLIRWHVPHHVAKFIAGRWLKRWLPAVGDWGGIGWKNSICLVVFFVSQGQTCKCSLIGR